MNQLKDAKDWISTLSSVPSALRRISYDYDCRNMVYRSHSEILAFPEHSDSYRVGVFGAEVKKVSAGNHRGKEEKTCLQVNDLAVATTERSGSRGKGWVMGAGDFSFEVGYPFVIEFADRRFEIITVPILTCHMGNIFAELVDANCGKALFRFREWPYCIERHWLSRLIRPFTSRPAPPVTPKDWRIFHFLPPDEIEKSQSLPAELSSVLAFAAIRYCLSCQLDHLSLAI